MKRILFLIICLMSFSAQAYVFYFLECEGNNLTTDGNPFYAKVYTSGSDTFARFYIPDDYYDRRYIRTNYGTVVEWYSSYGGDKEVGGLSPVWSLNKKTAQITLGVNDILQTHDCKKMDIREKDFDKFIEDQKRIKSKDNILPELG